MKKERAMFDNAEQKIVLATSLAELKNAYAIDQLLHERNLFCILSVQTKTFAAAALAVHMSLVGKRLQEASVSDFSLQFTCSKNLCEKYSTTLVLSKIADCRPGSYATNI